MLNYFRITDESFRLVYKNPMEEPAALSVPVMGLRDACAFQVLVQCDHYYSLQLNRQEYISVFNWQAGLQDRLRMEITSDLPVSAFIEDMHTDDDLLKRADALSHLPHKDSSPHLPLAVWVEMTSDENTRPGLYPVNIKVYHSGHNGDERLVKEETVQVEVLNVKMPLPKDRVMDFSLWQHPSNIARQHDVPIWSEEHFVLLDRYAKCLAGLGKSFITCMVSEIPWRGQSCFMDKLYGGDLYEYSMVRVTRDQSGAFKYDFSPMQRYIDLCRAAGLGPTVELFGLINVWDKPILTPQPMCREFPEAIRVRYLDEQDGCMKYMRSADHLREYVRAVYNYFVETEQVDQVILSADEPGDIEIFRTSMNMLKELCPRFKMHVSINHTEFIQEFSDRLCGFAPHLSCCLEQYDFLIEYKKNHPEVGLTWYMCCGSGFPNHFIRTHPIESRFTGPFTYYMGFDGFGRWAFTCWPKDPRQDVRYSEFEAGDPFFVYPARNGEPMLSLRYKNLQRGNTDFEILHMAEKKIGREQVLAMLEKIVPQGKLEEFNNFEYDLQPERPFSLIWEDYNTLKRDLLKLLAE